MIYSQFKDDFNLFLKNNALWICLALVLLITIVLIVILLMNKRRKGNKKINSSDWVTALGGKENILEVDATRSRLTIKCLDSSKINKESLNSLGVSNILEMSNKITLVLESKAEEIKKEILKSL